MEATFVLPDHVQSTVPVLVGLCGDCAAIRTYISVSDGRKPPHLNVRMSYTRARREH